MTVVHAMLGNAAVAAVLAMFALAAGYAFRSPTVRHVAWVLVLLKLVTPPLFNIPLPVLPASWNAQPPDARPNSAPVLHIASTAIPNALSTDSVEGTTAWWNRFTAAGLVDWLIFIWLAGAATWFFCQGRRVVRFRRRVARAEDAGPEIAKAARHIAQELGIARPPVVKTITGIGSPMLWGWGRGTIVLLPRELLNRLAPEARDTLLAHELAHFLRRDHWVRVLEFIATGLYWCHPAVWLARAEIEVAEEECCDAWVVGGLAASPRRYAEALLATVDFVAELRRPCLPPGACAANRGARLLHRRLVGIINARRPGRLRRPGAVRALVVMALLIQPVLTAAKPRAIEPPSEPVVVVARPRPHSLTKTARPLKSTEPRAWATATAPGGALTVIARDKEVILRRPDGTDTVLGPGRPLALAFAPDAKRVATVGPGSLVRTWSERGTLLAEARVPSAARAITYTPDGKRLLVLDATSTISVFDPQSLALVTNWSVERPANSIACAPDCQTIAVAFGSWLDQSGRVELWSITEQRRLVSYQASSPVGATRFAPDGGILVIGGWNGMLAWRTLPEGDLIAERQLTKDLVATAAFSPDAGTLPLEPPPEPEPLPPPLFVPTSAPELYHSPGQLAER